MALPQVGADLPVIWPPAGIALAALLRFGVTLWPGLWLGTFLLALFADAPGWLAALLAIGTTASTVLGAVVLQRDGLHPELDRRSDLLLYSGVGVGVAMVLGAVHTAFWLAATERLPWSVATHAGAYLWAGNAMGAVVIGIPLLTMSRESISRA